MKLGKISPQVSFDMLTNKCVNVIECVRCHASPASPASPDVAYEVVDSLSGSEPAVPAAEDEQECTDEMQSVQLMLAEHAKMFNIYNLKS